MGADKTVARAEMFFAVTIFHPFWCLGADESPAFFTDQDSPTQPTPSPEVFSPPARSISDNIEDSTEVDEDENSYLEHFPAFSNDPNFTWATRNKEPVTVLSVLIPVDEAKTNFSLRATKNKTVSRRAGRKRRTWRASRNRRTTQ